MSPKEVINLTQAIGNLTTATSAVSDAAKKLEEWSRKLDEKDARLKQTEERLNAKDRELEDKEKRLKEVEERMKGYEVAVKKLEENTAKLGPVVKFNVGGQNFAASKNTLLKYKGSYFDALLLSDPQQGTNDYFIDRDPECFQFLLNYLREGKVKDWKSKSWDVRLLREEFEFFGIPIPVDIPVVTNIPRLNHEKKFIDGDLLSEIHQNVLAQWLPEKRFTLIYKASRDGFSAANFHAKCDFPGTLTVIQSVGGWLFGGFASKSWKPTGDNQADESAFIFTLTNPHSIPPTKYTLKNDKIQFSIYCSNSYGATFGGGNDIYVSDNSNQNYSSHINFPHTYNDTTNKGKTTFTGSFRFTTKDIEVYSVVSI